MSYTAELLQFCEQWWLGREPGGVLNPGERELTETEFQRALELDGQMIDLEQTPAEFAGLIEALAETCPRPERLPFIGTWQLENAYQHMGLSVFQLFDRAALDADTKHVILSGFHF